MPEVASPLAAPSPAPADELLAALGAARERTLALVAPLSDDGASSACTRP